MSTTPDSERPRERPDERFEPHVRLVRCLLPRTSCVAMFGPAAELAWSTDPTQGPDLMNLVEDALDSVRADPYGSGQLRLLDDLPVYLRPLRDDAQALL